MYQQYHSAIQQALSAAKRPVVTVMTRVEHSCSALNASDAAVAAACAAAAMGTDSSSAEEESSQASCTDIEAIDGAPLCEYVSAERNTHALWVGHVPGFGCRRIEAERHGL